MRQKRAKAYRKLMALYSMSFGFRQPYQVLVDSEMCKDATEHKIELVKQLNSVLQGDMKPMITQCCIHELYLLGKTQQPAVDLAKTFERRKCNHREPIPGDDCLVSVVGETNKHRYVVATQSQPLRIKLRSIPAVPIVHVNRSVMVLEPPSDATIRSKEHSEEQALHLTGSEKRSLAPSMSTDPPPRKKKGPKGPNPLSVKKKKVANQPPAPKDKRKDTAVGEKRKRADTDDMETATTDQRSADLQQQDEPRRKKKRRRKAADGIVDS
ncbi:Fcf1-domain-containing protein [Mycena haematopus]|nr:Fcf1-domain-containing protein [Mycena haematopus]